MEGEQAAGGRIEALQGLERPAQRARLPQQRILLFAQ